MVKGERWRRRNKCDKSKNRGRYFYWTRHTLVGE